MTWNSIIFKIIKKIETIERVHLTMSSFSFSCHCVPCVILRKRFNFSGPSFLRYNGKWLTWMNTPVPSHFWFSVCLLLLLIHCFYQEKVSSNVRNKCCKEDIKTKVATLAYLFKPGIQTIPGLLNYLKVFWWPSLFLSSCVLSNLRFAPVVYNLDAASFWKSFITMLNSGASRWN